MRDRNRSVAALLAVLCLLSVSCIRLRTPYPEKSHFVLDVSRDASKGEKLKGISLRVRAADAAPLVQGQGLVWRKSDVQWEEDFYHLFFAPPVPMVAEETRQWLASSGRFGWVLQSGSRVEAMYCLEVGILELYGDLCSKGSPKAVLGLVFTLTEDARGGPKIHFQGEYEERVAIEETTPEALVDGWNQGLCQILESFEQDLVEALLAER